MSRLLTKQPFKCLRGSFIHRPSLFSLSSSYHCRLQTYDVVAKALASYPKRLNDIAEKRRKLERNQPFVDIEDLDTIQPQDYDVLITDIDEGKLKSEIAEDLGVDYLGKATRGQASIKAEYIDGLLCGRRRRPVLPCVVQYGDKAAWVIFVVDTSAPATYLSPYACDALGLRKGGPTSALIAGYKHTIQPSPSKSHFANINLLGSDFLDDNKTSVCFLGNGKIRYFFEGRSQC